MVISLGIYRNAFATSQVDRAMYIWSSTQKDLGATGVKKYLVKNNIATALVSLGDGNKSVFKKLLKELPRKGIRFEILIGNYRLLLDDNPEEYFDDLLDGLDISSIAALHLDVEPYARSVFPDYRERQDYYDDLYINLLRKAKDYADNHNMELSVDIPVFYRESTLENIYHYADNVYVMAYEIESISYLKKRTKEELALGKHKTIIALRANDFNNRSEFESYIERAQGTLNIDSFAMHDLRRFREFDNN